MCITWFRADYDSFITSITTYLDFCSLTIDDLHGLLRNHEIWLNQDILLLLLHHILMLSIANSRILTHYLQLVSYFVIPEEAWPVGVLLLLGSTESKSSGGCSSSVHRWKGKYFFMSRKGGWSLRLKLMTPVTKVKVLVTKCLTYEERETLGKMVSLWISMMEYTSEARLISAKLCPTQHEGCQKLVKELDKEKAKVARLRHLQRVQNQKKTALKCLYEEVVPPRPLKCLYEKVVEVDLDTERETRPPHPALPLRS
uniref:Uncharacterized protein n=1 Tax=Nelumbo nucifera TaxID=4432 RepID=A0A822ZUG9_NELNU|nr:TPA_asm: hypothetical protein HUJ06_016876 [Nelumbo nucifera]